MNTPPAIQISALEKHYKKFSLGPVDLSVPTGSIYGLIGPNGAGKSTLIDQIFGMGTPNSGTIKVDGFDHERDEVSVKQRTAYVGPDLNYQAWNKVAKAIRFVRGFRPTWDDAYCARLMETFGISAGDKIASLSFGGRTKLLLILALAWHPQVLILDEPTTGLDTHAKQTLFAELLGIVRDEKRTVLISSHQISDLERFADQIGVLHKGRMVAEGAPGELLQRYSSVEFLTPNPDLFSDARGFLLQSRNGNAVRALLNTSEYEVNLLKEKGATDLQTHPLTLEELFLALTK